MKFHILTLFPETVRCFFRESIVRRAVDKGIIEVDVMDIREYSLDKHKKVDDYPFGGGRGMVMCPDPLFRALESIGERGKAIYLSPAGALLAQAKVRELAKSPVITMICGRYEGIDQRVIDHFVDETISIGDYVLTGGELAAAVLADSVTRELESVLGNSESRMEESFDETGLLEYEQYTRPATYRGRDVPQVLLNGNHAEIERWRLKRRIINTAKVRPDLFARIPLTREMEILQDETTKEKEQ
jgi:tRNA (guanine37-N1)-methyltransferase